MSGPDIPLYDLRLEPEDLEAVAETLRSGWLTMGPNVAEFERRFAEQLGVAHAVAVSSCTAALHLAYLAADVGPGDEVIVPTYTFAATANAVIYCGGKPIFADVVGQHDLNIDVEDVERRITPRTRAICAVHFAGYPARVDLLRDLCLEHGIALIEDAAHAPCASLDGVPLGAWGRAGAFSFFSNKILSVGEGGLLSTNDDGVAEVARTLRSQGMTSGTWSRHTQATDGYDVVARGFNYRLDEPRAALLLSRLGRLEADVRRRRELTRGYRERLAGIEQVSVPFTDAGVAHASCYVMPVVLDAPERQGPVRAHMREHGVQTSLLYPAVHEFSAYRERYGAQSLPHAELAARTEVTLPLYPHMSEADQDRVVAALTDALEHAGTRAA